MGKQKAPRRVAENEALSVGNADPRLGAEAQSRRGPDPRQEGRRGAQHPELLAQGDGAGTSARCSPRAIANAENNHNLDVDALVVAEASVGKSISMKRFTPRARGRASRIVKPFSRVRIVVREQQEA